MQERRKPESMWHPYIDILPKMFTNFPIFYTPEEKEWLIGSPFLKQVEEKIEDIKTDYNLICKEVPEFAEFPLKEYSEMRMMVSSRIFGIQVEGVKTDGFAPYADMLNHRRPRQTTWTYTDDRAGFIIEALDDIPRGEQVYDSYGKKCNSRFLLNYGFINLNNDANEVPLKIYYNDNDTFMQVKKDMINDNSDFKKFRVVENMEDRIMYELLSWVRFVEYDENMTLIMEYQGRAISQAKKQRYHDDSDSDEEDPSKGFKAKDLPPLSIKNEKQVLERIGKEAALVYHGYATSYEDDLEILAKGGLTFNEENCVLMRSGEKKILLFLMTVTEKLIPMFDMKLKDAKKALNSLKEAELVRTYFNDVIVHLINKKAMS